MRCCQDRELQWHPGPRPGTRGAVALWHVVLTGDLVSCLLIAPRRAGRRVGLPWGRRPDRGRLMLLRERLAQLHQRGTEEQRRDPERDRVVDEGCGCGLGTGWW